MLPPPDCGLKAHQSRAQLQACDYGQRNVCDLKGREKFSHSGRSRLATFQVAHFVFILFTGLKPCALFSWAFSPQGMTGFDKTEVPMTHPDIFFSPSFCPPSFCQVFGIYFGRP